MSSYFEYRPAPLLQRQIDSFWVSTTSAHESAVRVLPDGFVDVIVSLSEAATSTFEDAVFVSGMMTSYRDVVAPIGTLLGVRFKPGHLRGLLPISLAAVKNGRITARDAALQLDKHVVEQLMACGSVQEQLALFEGEITQLLLRNQLPVDEVVEAVSARIDALPQQLDLKALVEMSSLSLRQLERRFKNAVGVTLKEYQQIARFKNTLRALPKNQTQNLQQLAYDLGYSDHAHLSRVLQSMAGTNPSTYR